MSSPTLSARTPRRIALVAAAALLLAWSPCPPAAAQDEGYDIMRLITSQWVKPNVTLVMDQSGSTNWPAIYDDNLDATDDWATLGTYNTVTFTDSAGVTHTVFPRRGVDSDALITGGNSDGPFDDDNRRLFPRGGTGQGYWVKVDRYRDPAQLRRTTVSTYNNGSVTANQRYINIAQSNPGFATYDYLWLSNYGGVGNNALYQVTSVAANGSYTNARIYVTKVLTDGLAKWGDDYRYLFPTADGSVTAQEVRIGALDLGQMVDRGAAVTNAQFIRTSSTQRLYVPQGLGWRAGDLIRVTGMTTAADNHYYILKTDPTNTASPAGYAYFTVARFDANNTWDNTDGTYTFVTAANDPSVTVQRVMPPAADIPGDPYWVHVESTRMAIMKNVLGRHLTLNQPAEGVTPAGTDANGKDYYRFADGAGPDAPGSAYYDWYLKMWVNYDEEVHDGIPPSVNDVTEVLEPADLVQTFGDVINWGLVSYSGDCTTQTIRVEVNPDDSNQTPSIEAIEEFMRTQADGGLVANGSTPTRAALDRARDLLLLGWSSGGVTYQSTWARDTKRNCDRTYGVILMTDGQSNNCNPSNGSWSSCPSSWNSYPAGKSELLWNGTNASGTFLTNVRTWVIGVSPEVGRCELNYTAYRGRTDASSPNADAGFDTASDPRLPGSTPGTYDSSQDYAFFTNTAEELYSAFASIIAGMGVGDYATAPPSVSSGGGVSSDLVALLASTDYPGWKGHLRAFDLSLPDTDPNYLMWDAADVLNTGNASLARRIYTWNPRSSNAMVEVTAGNLVTLETICDACGMTAQVVDFIRGNDGSGTARDLQLGALINTTPALSGTPRKWKGNLLHEHSSFENTYANRHTLAYVATSDGMVRAIDMVDGAEVLALIPPDKLDQQVELYENYLSDPTNLPLGQPSLPSDHVYGVTNSMRISDVYFPLGGGYRTVLFITEGPGGSGIHAVDITHPYPGRTIGTETYDPDVNYGFGAGPTGPPVQAIWSRTADGESGTTALTDLGVTWSIPAVAAVANEDWGLLVGGGYRDNAGNALRPRSYLIDPVDGTPITGNFSNSSPQLTNSGSFWVGNQSFADAVFWQKNSPYYQADNVANEGLQGDLNGHLWQLTRAGSTVTASALVSLPSPEPIYYAAAAAGYPTAVPVQFALYAFASGSFFEKSADITGSDVGTVGHFIPKLYVAARTLSSGVVDYVGIETQDLPDPDGGTLGRRTQVTAPPMIFTPREGSSAQPFALFLLYDPDASACIGYSYIARVNFDPNDLSLLPADIPGNVDVYSAGEGTAGGFALAGERVLVSQSGVGEGEEAHLVEVPGLIIPTGGGMENVSWWVELQ